MSEWQYVQSSNVDAIKYCRDASELYVRFREGREYVYYDVDERVFQELLHAASVGKYHARNIKGRYKYLRLC